MLCLQPTPAHELWEKQDQCPRKTRELGVCSRVRQASRLGMTLCRWAGRAPGSVTSLAVSVWSQVSVGERDAYLRTSSPDERAAETARQSPRFKRWLLPRGAVGLYQTRSLCLQTDAFITSTHGWLSTCQRPLRPQTEFTRAGKRDIQGPRRHLPPSVALLTPPPRPPAHVLEAAA